MIFVFFFIGFYVIFLKIKLFCRFFFQKEDGSIFFQFFSDKMNIYYIVVYCIVSVNVDSIVMVFIQGGEFWYRYGIVVVYGN